MVITVNFGGEMNDSYKDQKNFKPMFVFQEFVFSDKRIKRLLIVGNTYSVLMS